MKKNDDMPMFSAHCMHPPDVSGDHPVIDWASAHYRGYFENEHGEQWLLWQDDDGVHFAGGDCGWEVNTFSLAQLEQRDIHLGYILNRGELAWFMACFTVIRSSVYPHNGPTNVVMQPATDPKQRPTKHTRATT